MLCRKQTETPVTSQRYIYVNTKRYLIIVEEAIAKNKYMWKSLLSLVDCMYVCMSLIAAME